MKNEKEEKLLSMIIALDGFKKKEVKLSNDSRYLNTLVLGQKGTGKSDHVLLNMFYQDLMTKDHSLFVFTSKGDTSYKLYTLAKHVGRKVHLIKPETNTFNINLLSGEEQDVIEYMVQLLSHTFKKDHISEMFYQEMNKTLLIYSLKVIKRTLGDQGTIEDVYDLISNLNGAGRKRVIEFSRIKQEDSLLEKENATISSWFLNEYFTDKENRIFDYCGAVRMKIRELVDIQNTYNFAPEEEDLPDLKKVLKNKEIVIVDTEFLTYKEYANFMGTYLLLKIKNELLQTESADSFVYIDDFQKFYPVLTELFEGSHINNIGVTLFLQDTNQLNVYPEYKSVIMNSVANLILLERIAFEDYLYYKTHVNAELLNRKRGEVVYRLINREGTVDSANGALYANEKLILHYEKYLDLKKNLIRKKKKRVTKKVEPVEKEETTVRVTITEQKMEETVNERPDEIEIIIPLPVTKPFEQVKREGDGKEYLSPSQLFDNDENDND
jgi:hypothetical protein